jgi:putative membrane protein
MIVSNQGSVFRLLAWQWRNSLLFVVTGLLAQFLHVVPRWTHLHLPATPIAVVGGAIGIFVSFRSNHGYARWWEGRQLWGRLINNARDLGSFAVATLAPGLAREVVRRQIAFAHVLRCNLRDQDAMRDPDVVAFTDEAERAALAGERNAAFALLHAQRVAVTRASDAGALSDLRLQTFDRILGNLHDVQGGCERIKKTPFPRGYGFIAERLILAFGCLLPFALVRDLGWFTVPMNLLVCSSFSLISEAGRVLEDPFTMFWNGLPLGAMSKTIEINLRQRLGEQGVPALPQPDERGILM